MAEVTAVADDSVLTSAIWDEVREKVIVTCLSSARPTNIEGRRIYETDTDRELLGDGTNWIIMAEPVQSHTMTVTSQTGTITTVGAKSFTYRRSDGWLTWYASIAITTNGTGATGILFTLPVNVVGTATSIGTGRETVSTGNALQVIATAGTASCYTYDNLYPGGTGYTLQMHGVYRMTNRYS
jgi:hypothetical protein